MHDAIEWVLETDIKDGKMDDLKTLIMDMTASMKTDEPGTLHFEWFIDAESTKCTTVERYQDNDAAMAHLAIFKEKYAPRILDVLAPFRLTVYGPATPELRATMEGFNAVHFEPFGGFCR